MEVFEINGDVLVSYHLREETVVVPEGVRVIHAGAFKGCTGIKRILLPASLERIEAQAFKGCRQLESIHFPEGLTYLGAYAFHKCHHLREIRLPLGISELPDCVFLYCDGLELAELPGVKKMGRHLFVNAINLRKLVISEELSPECISDTFTGCTKISEITVVGNSYQISYQIDHLISAMKSNNLPRIAKAVIADIYHMMTIEHNHNVLMEFHVEVKKLEIPEGITAIGKSCFFDKRGIMEIRFPKSLKKIGECAFRNCINLEHIVFPKEDIEICEAAFEHCTSLKKITLKEKEYLLTGLPMNRKADAMPEIIVTIHTQILGNFCISGTVLLRYLGEEERVTVPEGITVIGERAFAGNEAVGRVILPESVVEIQTEAFADCLLLQTLNFPKGLKHIGNAAFEGCVKLLRAEIPKGITRLSPSIFSRCKKLKQILWEEAMLLEIGQQAFYGCHSLSSAVFPKSLKKIGALAFYQCDSLTELVLPKEISYIGAEAFACCKRIRKIVVKSSIQKWGRNIAAYAEKLEELAFCGDQAVIPDYFAWKCQKLVTVTFPDTLKNIGIAAFEGTLFLNSLPKPRIVGTVFLDGRDLEGAVELPEGITAVAGGAFYGNEKITSIILPKTLEALGERAFCSCILLKNVVLPERITIIPNGAFAYCTGLEKISWKNEIREVGEKAFYQCGKLTEVPLLQNAVIGDYAFFGCKKWSNGIIRHCRIGAYAFRETGVLKSCLRDNKIAVIGETIVEFYETEKEVAVPAGVHSIAAYACYGNKTITRLFLPEGLKEIGAFAFCGCTELCEVVIPDSVKVICNSAFEKCTKIQTFSSAALFLGQRVFALCKELQTITLPYVKELGKEVFFQCQNLKKADAERVESVGRACFKGCEKLLDLPSKQLKKLKEEAFLGCESLQNLSFSFGVKIAARAFFDCCGLLELSFADKIDSTVSYDVLSYDILPDNDLLHDVLFHSALLHGIFDYTSFSGCTFLEKVQLAGKDYFLSGYKDLFREDLPEFVKRIYASVLSCFYFQDTKAIAGYKNNARAIRIPKGLSAIYGEVFKDCIRLERVEIPEDIVSIGERAFWGTAWLKRKKEETPLVIVNRILLDGTSASGRVEIPKEVSIISGWAFANCYGLSELVLLSQRLIIEPHAFRNCIYLQRVITAEGKSYPMKGLSVRTDLSLPADIRHIFEDALNCYKTDENNILVECTGNITNFSLAYGITAIGKGVFQESNLLTYAVLTEEVEWIGESAFAFCKWLVSISHAENIKEIGAMAFLGCVRLEVVQTLHSLERLGKRAFENCVSLREIILPEGLKEIPRRAFFRCRSLERLVLPSSLETIGEEAFAFCSSLHKIVLPKGLKEIGARGFAWCETLEPVELPEGIKLSERVFEFSGRAQKGNRK